MPDNAELTMLFVGDVYVRRADPPSIFAHVAPLLREADVAFGNLEAPITDRGEPILGKPIAGVNFRSPPDAVSALTFAGFDAMGLANNHSMDFGASGRAQTVAALDRAGIAHTGFQPFGGFVVIELRVPRLDLGGAERESLPLRAP